MKLNVLFYHSRLSRKEKELGILCVEVFSLEMLEKDDSVLPEEMISCLERLLAETDRLVALLSGARLWITKYYAVMLDGEVCLPWNWDFTEEEKRNFRTNT